MFDGLDGSGKGTLVNALKEYYEDKNKKVFDLREYWKENNDIPDITQLQEFDIIISSEPTHSMIGKVIREEIISKNARKYSGLSTAHAFALDREILYKKVIIPALRAGKTIIQERGVITSLVYQPVQLERITLRDIIYLPGNMLALKNTPDFLIITTVSPATVMKRLEAREKKDNAIFEERMFQRKIDERYRSEWLRKIFEKQGTKVIYFDTDEPKTVEDSSREIIELWEQENKEHTVVRHM
jgi:thymidylate kinase